MKIRMRMVLEELEHFFSRYNKLTSPEICSTIKAGNHCAGMVREKWNVDCSINNTKFSKLHC
jgi:hypothetical protein